MTQSAEYPDLRWIQPRAYGRGRDGKAVQYIVIHYTAGAERATSAEDGAAYDQRRTDGTSTHYFVDQNSVVQCIHTADRANAARHRGNRLGIQYELCGTVQTRAQWLDVASMATLKLAARQVARDCRKYGIPARRLTVAETRRAWTEYPAGPKGIVGHVDCTRAYPEDGGDHTDPGAEFPWDIFLGLVRAELQEDDMPSVTEIVSGVRNTREFLSDTQVMIIGQEVERRLAPTLSRLERASSLEAAEVPPTLEQIRDAITAVFAGQPTPEQQANMLRAVLGDNAQAVGRILARP